MVAGEATKWTREQLLTALALYCQIPFGKMHKGNPAIVETAKQLGRTPSSLAMKLVNFASLDPAITTSGRRGLGNASALDRVVWNEVHAEWEKVAREVLPVTTIGVPLSSDEEAQLETFAVADKKALVQVRVKQAFFRNAVLSSYQEKCCMTGVANRALLNASHIVPWKVDRQNRLNPRNGLCLSALHDRAFDRGLISVGPDLRIKISTRLKRAKDEFLHASLVSLEGEKIRMPEKFAPEREFLEYHATKVFEG